MMLGNKLKAIISNKNWADFFLFPTPSKRFVWFVWFVWFAWGCLMVCFNIEPECRLQWGGSIMSMDTWYNTLLSLRIVGNNLLLFMSARSTYYFNRFISKSCLNRVNFLHCSVLPSFMIILMLNDISAKLLIMQIDWKGFGEAFLFTWWY